MSFNGIISGFFSRLNFFSGIDFSILWNWLPDDIGAVCMLIVTISVVLFVIGLIKKVLPL